MGVSTNAILFYGYCWDEDMELFPDQDDWPKIVAKKRGIIDPWDRYVEPDKNLRYDAREKLTKEWTDANRKELDAWYAAKKDIEREFGCEIGSHCSDNDPIPYIAIAGSGMTVHRGYPKNISAEDLKVEPSWDAKLKRFCDEVGVSPPEGQSPQWWLVSYWG